MKYPIGIQCFEQIVEGGYVYVDKTELVYDLAHNGMVYFLCRPRRFGKSLLVSTLKCYFEGRVDCVVKTPLHVYNFEFKRDGSAEETLTQIEPKGYAREYAVDERTVHQIGCNFSSTTGTIDGWKVKY